MKQPIPILNSAALQDAVAEMEAAAYRRGADDAIRALKEALQAGMSEQFSKVAVSLIFTKTITKRGPKRSLTVRENSNAARVLGAIKTEPGLTGARLFRYLEDHDSAVNERTMRTALRRLRNRGLIEQNANGGWIIK